MYHILDGHKKEESYYIFGLTNNTCNIFYLSAETVVKYGVKGLLLDSEICYTTFPSK